MMSNAQVHYTGEQSQMDQSPQFQWQAPLPPWDLTNFERRPSYHLLPDPYLTPELPYNTLNMPQMAPMQSYMESGLDYGSRTNYGSNLNDLEAALFGLGSNLYEQCPSLPGPQDFPVSEKYFISQRRH